MTENTHIEMPEPNASEPNAELALEPTLEPVKDPIKEPTKEPTQEPSLETKNNTDTIVSEVYLLKNQQGELLTKAGEWVTATQIPGLYQTTFRDEAINQKVELTVKQPELRIMITTVKDENESTFTLS